MKSNESNLSNSKQNNSSNKTMRNDFIHASIIGLITGLVVSVINSYKQGISLGLIFWPISGGTACIQHFILRLILYSKGYIPWNYTKFLNYATERLILQRIGGSYSFIHSLLEEHFVDMSIKTKLNHQD